MRRSTKNPDFDPNESKLQRIIPGENKPIGKYVEELEVLLNTRGTFIINFNEELVKFRKTK